MQRRKTRRMTAGNVAIGGDAPVTVQGMTRTPCEDVEGNLAEIAAAVRAGVDIMRLAVPSETSAAAFGRVAARSPVPLVADTHFDWRATLAAIREGAAKVRINPGNMDRDGLARVIDAAGAKGIPIRVGGNSGSIRHRNRDGSRPIPDLMAEEALAWAGEMENLGFRDIVLSLKANDAAGTVRANRIAAERSDYPLHLGVTAAGPREEAILKSAAAVGSLLLDGIGDTIRFSFTGDPVGEIEAGRSLLRSLDVDRSGPVIISCPACGRCRVDLPGLVAEVKTRLKHIGAPIRVAVMGCEVNGPGEAREADVGIASAGGIIHLFVRGGVVEKVAAEKAVDRLIEEAEKAAGQFRG